jgi:opacity protein-like surface antigen
MSNAVTKSFLLLVAISVLALAAPAFAGSANDPVSGLPLAPGMTPSNDALSITICGKPAQANQYLDAPDTVPTAIARYKAHLPGYHMVHAVWSDRSQDTFFSPDGTKGVNITGTPKSDRVFSVMYLSLKTGITEHQWMAFSPSNPSCK